MVAAPRDSHQISQGPWPVAGIYDIDDEFFYEFMNNTLWRIFFPYEVDGPAKSCTSG